MNKAIYMGIVAAMALASCSNDEVLREAERADTISFRTQVAASTRGALLDQAVLQGNNQLYVTTFKEDGELLYPETEYNYDKKEGAWAANPPQQWQGNDKLDFYLAYPALSEWRKNFELSKPSKMITFLVDEEISNQKDYVAARVLASKQDGTVEVKLKHMLAAVEVRVKNSNPTLKYTMSGVRLCGVNKEATVRLDEINNPNFRVLYGTPMTRNYKIDICPTELTPNGSVVSLMGENKFAILPPQPGNPKWNGERTEVHPESPVGTYIGVLLQIRNKYGAFIYPANGGFGRVAIPMEFKWDSGKKYVYTLDFSNGAGRVDPTDPGVDVHPGTLDPEKGQPIFNGPVTFTVDVSEWTNENRDVDLKQ